MSGLDNRSDTAKTVATNSVTYVSYENPITAVDQNGNKYICLSRYEANAVGVCLKRLAEYQSVLSGFNTGDWFSDLPGKIDRWLVALDIEANPEAYTEVKDVFAELDGHTDPTSLPLNPTAAEFVGRTIALVDGVGGEMTVEFDGIECTLRLSQQDTRSTRKPSKGQQKNAKSNATRAGE